MSPTGTSTATETRTYGQELSASGSNDVAESVIRKMDRSVKEATGVSLFHMLTIGSIGASIGLFLAGRRSLAIFIGLWPPTFQALKAAAENTKESDQR